MMMKTSALVLAGLLVAAPSFADEPPTPKAFVIHVAPATAIAGEPIDLEAVIDHPYVEQLAVRWRALGATAWADVPFERSSTGAWYAQLPAASSPGVEYYIRGLDRAGAGVDHFASEASPHPIRVDPVISDRLEALDLARLGSLRDELAIDANGHDFTNRYGARDRFVRAEATFTHRMLRSLYEIGFGFGTIFGRTPIAEEPSTMDTVRGMRYGFGQVRLRALPSVFFDLRAGLGVTETGFTGLVRGGVTFGRPWRSCVQLAAEYMGDLGPTLSMRLQWDSAAPLLMGASIVKTDLPGALVGPNGLYIAYDIAFRATESVTLRGQISYGARDGGAGFGGGIGTGVAF